MSTPRCTICDCERIPLNREKTKFGACTNIECRDPLYDYRGENPYKSVPKPAEGVAAPLEPSQRRIIQAARDADWQQVILNGGPPCFYIGDDGDERFCLRAESWHYPQTHPFTSLEDLLAAAVSKKAERERDAAVVTLRAMCGDNWQSMGRNFAESLANIENEKKRAENLQEELAETKATLRRWENAWMQDETIGRTKGKLDGTLRPSLAKTIERADRAESRILELEKEIAALRETQP